jgi:putative PIN family toxin of toxin-antitoxin system
MIRVVVDTNIVVSSLLQRQGVPAQVLLLALNHPGLQLCVSGEIYAEYEDVVSRPKFKRSEAEREHILRAIREHALWVKPTDKLRVCSDPDDNIFLECAATARAHYLVTGNVKHFPAQWSDTRILTARQFVDLAGTPGLLDR